MFPVLQQNQPHLAVYGPKSVVTFFPIHSDTRQTSPQLWSATLRISRGIDIFESLHAEMQGRCQAPATAGCKRKHHDLPNPRCRSATFAATLAVSVQGINKAMQRSLPERCCTAAPRTGISAKPWHSFRTSRQRWKALQNIYILHSCHTVLFALG